jgi:sigma-B regulation protein RsbU (phosphoserine phosphatase)
MPRLGLGHPLGIVPDSELDEQRIAVPPGGLLLLYTDGVTEAMDPSGALFRLTGLQAAMSAQPAGPAQTACDRLVAMLEAYRDSAPQADDITLVAVRAAGV